MTGNEFKQLKAILDAKVKEGKLNSNDMCATLATLKLVYGRCLDCKWNDGLPHSACYNCD